MIPLEQLPQVAFCQTDTAAVEAACIALYEEITGRTLYPGNPERLFVEAVAYLIAQQRFLIDYTGKQNLLAYSAGGFLDHLGALLDTARSGSAFASTTLRFSLAGPLTFAVTIPAGTRATADSVLMWATTEETTIAAGETQVEVPAVCGQAGTIGNGLLPGQINRLVDRVTYLAKVSNTRLTLGGTDAETDKRLRGRVQLAPERFSTCGPEDAYRYWAMSVSPAIVDVGVWVPEPGQIRLAPLMTNGEMPSAEILSAVFEAVSAKNRRPYDETVQAVPPTAVNFNAAATYWVRSSYAARAGEIAGKAQKALSDWAAWQKAKLGRAVNPSKLAAAIQGIEGVQRVEITEPIYQALDPWAVAIAGQTALTYGGLSDD